MAGQPAPLTLRMPGAIAAHELRAAWVLWDPVEQIVEIRKTDYNHLQSARDIMNAELPLESAK